MTEQKEITQEYLIQNNLVKLPCRFDAGEYMGRFFTELRDHKRIWASKCPQCGRLACPPKSHCGKCLGVEMTEWVEQADEGELVGFDIHYYEFLHPRTGQVRKVPWADGLLLLDGGAYFWHFVVPPDPEKLKLGDRYKVIWKEDERTGEVFDILHFAKKEDGDSSQVTKSGLSEPPQPKEPHSVTGKLEVPYHQSVGALASKFFVELRDNRKILGSCCPKCNKVYMPPLSVCEKCFTKLDKCVELSGRGTVTSFTEVRYSEPSHPVKAPFVIAIIQMDGADTSITHLLGDVKFKDVEIGMRVEPVFKEKREGNILDIKYFRPI